METTTRQSVVNDPLGPSVLFKILFWYFRRYTYRVIINYVIYNINVGLASFPVINITSSTSFRSVFSFSKALPASWNCDGRACYGLYCVCLSCRSLDGRSWTWWVIKAAAQMPVWPLLPSPPFVCCVAFTWFNTDNMHLHTPLMLIFHTPL